MPANVPENRWPTNYLPKSLLLTTSKAGPTKRKKILTAWLKPTGLLLILDFNSWCIYTDLQ